MGYIKNEDIRGYRFEDGTILCPECMAPEDLKDVTEDEILTDKDVNTEEGAYFCDRCKKQLECDR